VATSEGVEDLDELYYGRYEFVYQRVDLAAQHLALQELGVVPAFQAAARSRRLDRFRHAHVSEEKTKYR
jgi:hypothetical protein